MMINKIELPPLEVIEEIGAAFGRGFYKALAEYEAAQVVTENITNGNMGEDDPQERDKTQIQDCRKCWCDSCTKIESCEKMRGGFVPDGIRPRPCIGCFDSMRFMPLELKHCGDYVKGGLNNG